MHRRVSISVVVRKNQRWLFRPHYVHTCRSQYFQAMHCIKMLELPTGRRASKWSQGLVLLFCFLLVNKHNKIAISCSWPKAFDQGSVKVDGKHAILHWVLGIESEIRDVHTVSQKSWQTIVVLSTLFSMSLQYWQCSIVALILLAAFDYSIG